MSKIKGFVNGGKLWSFGYDLNINFCSISNIFFLRPPSSLVEVAHPLSSDQQGLEPRLVFFFFLQSKDVHVTPGRISIKFFSRRR